VDHPKLGVMVARGALINCSMFCSVSENLETVVRRYLRLCALFDNAYQNTKYTVQRMLQENAHKTVADLGSGRAVKAICQCKSNADLINLWCGADGASGTAPPDGLGKELSLRGLLGILDAVASRRANGTEPAAAHRYDDAYILDDAGHEMGHGVGSAIANNDTSGAVCVEEGAGKPAESGGDATPTGDAGAGGRATGSEDCSRLLCATKRSSAAFEREALCGQPRDGGAPDHAGAAVAPEDNQQQKRVRQA